MGFTLVDGVYVAIPPGERGGFRASVLDLDFYLRDGEIAIYDPVAGEWVQTRAERTETAEARAAQEVTRAENAETRAETAEARAEQETTRAKNAEAEAAQLREELARLKARH